MESLLRTRYLLVADTGCGELLLVNTLTGALHRLPVEMRHLVEGAGRSIDPIGLDATSQNVLYQLRRWGYFFSSEAEEEAMFEMLRQRVEEIRRGRPSLHSVAVTHSCFFRCVYCFERDITSHTPCLSNDDVEPFLDGLAVLEAHIGAAVPPHVALYGGEPLQPRTRCVVEKLVTVGGDRGISFTAVTNGFFLSEFVPVFAARTSSFKGIQVVIDGPPEVHDRRRMLKEGGGTFERIAAGITAALDAGLPVSVRVNLDRDNLDSLPLLAAAFNDRGWTANQGFSALAARVEDHLCDGLPHIFSDDELVAAYLRLEAGHPEAVALFDSEGVFGPIWYVESRLRQRREIVLPKFAYCAAHSGKGMCFGADGAIYPCHEALEDADARIGSFLPRFALDEARLAAWLGRSVAAVPRCRACAAATVCGGGCAYHQMRLGLPFDSGTCPPIARLLEAYVLPRQNLIHRLVPSAATPEGPR